VYKILLIRPAWLILGLHLVLAPAPAGAREMSSKRECAICHVMWIDAFRSDRETLIPWQGGNVLMKDTQGVVSAEDNCYSCHDGYVSDSRAVAWKAKNHPTFVKPGPPMNVPEQLPLSNKDEVYCGTCHTPHAGSEDAALASLQPSSFLRVEYGTSRLCAMCHDDKADYRRTNGHPLVAMEHAVPVDLRILGSKGGPDNRSLVCQTCHKIHGAPGDKIIVVADTSARLCTACHTHQSGILGSRHDLRLQEKNATVAVPLKWGTCGGCHTPHGAKGRPLWSRPQGPGNPASAMCLSCHTQGADYPGREIGRISHPIDRRPAKTAGSHLPLYTADGRLSPARGSVQCLTCHDVHRWSPDSTASMAPDQTEGDGRNSFLRVATARDAALCLSCHEDKNSVIPSAHNMAVSAPGTVNAMSQAVAASGPCSACHLPHQALGWQLWARPLEPGNPVSQTCLSCHGDTPQRPGKTIGRSHPINIALSSGMTSALPRYADDGGPADPGSIQCGTCHDVHRWRPGPLTQEEGSPLEGDGTSSFLRMDNGAEAALCAGCHADKALVSGTSHDLALTAPGAPNILGQTAPRSGSCSGCHVAHNSPNALMLWAQPLAAVEKDAVPLNALCGSCHAPGRIAAQRIPPVASHPGGKLMTNVRRYDPGRSDWTPLFDHQGQSRRVGDIGCPSCHNAHQGAAPPKATQPPDAGAWPRGFRFLRTGSAHMICAECHGPESLYRYLYFHDPERRKRY
jgi:predicted CXXCH cytochrome family protein